MKKLAIICPKPPWFNEGQARVVREHSIRLSKKFNVEIFCCDPSGKELGIHNWNNIKIHVYKGYNSAYLFSYQLFKELKKREFDIIHSHGFTTFMPLLACFIKTNKLIFQPHYHPIGSTLSLKILRKIYDPIIGKFIIKKSNKILCVSEYERNKLIKKLKIKENKIKVIYDGIDYESFVKAKPFKTNKKLILYIGRLEKYKNIHPIIRAMQYIKNYDFFIIGRGPYKDNLQNLIKELNLEKNVKILSDVNDEDVRRWYKTCNIFMTLSKIESFGLTVIEALASGKLVIVNNKMSLSELANKFKGRVIPINLDEISSKKLSNVIKKNINKKININNISLNDFNWDNITKKIIGVYNEK